jgi:hypothetical protein
MAEKVVSRLPRLTFIDFALVGLASCLAGFSAGMGLLNLELALIFVGIAVVGTCVSALLQRLVPRKRASLDGLFYAICAVVCGFQYQSLNSMLPGDGFPAPLAIAGWLCWMLVFGSFFMWRDSTVLFQAVPGIAVFGLVGTWDTFNASPFFFFAFLLCYATLFARAHARTMLVRASESGYQSNALDEDAPGGFWRALKRGPWRWVAGPEWALGSALAVVVISVLGAPVFQWSMEKAGVAGLVKIPSPSRYINNNRRAQTNNTSSSVNFLAADQYSIGNGPIGELSKTKILRLHYDADFPYLRSHTYSSFSGRGWQVVSSLAGTITNGLKNADFVLNSRAAQNYRLADFHLSYVAGKFDSVPVPGDLDRLEMPDYSMRIDGTVSNTRATFGGLINGVDGTVRVPITTGVLQSPHDHTLPAVYSNADRTMIIRDRVRDFALKTVKGIKSDFGKAEALRKAISQTIVYNLDAAQVPRGKDPVEYTLFEGKEGYCDVFATSMVTLARAVNLPARFVVGYAPFRKRSQDGFYDIYASDYHAWAEVYFKGAGWLIFDATEGAKEVPGRGRGAATEGGEWYQQLWAKIGAGVIGLALLVCLGLLMVRVVKKIKVRPARQRRAELEKLYIDLIKTLESKTGKPRRPSQTPFEYMETVRSYLNGSYEPVRNATDAFVGTFYSSKDPDPEMIARVRALVQEAKLSLKDVKRPKESRHEIS